MDEERKINWDAIFPDLEERWRAWDNSQRQKCLQELALPVPASDWTLLCRLVRVKKGRMIGEAVEQYLKDFFEVPDLRWVTRKEVQEAIQYMVQLPDRPMS